MRKPPPHYLWNNRLLLLFLVSSALLCLQSQPPSLSSSEHWFWFTEGGTVWHGHCTSVIPAARKAETGGSLVSRLLSIWERKFNNPLSLHHFSASAYLYFRVSHSYSACLQLTCTNTAEFLQVLWPGIRESHDTWMLLFWTANLQIQLFLSVHTGFSNIT